MKTLKNLIGSLIRDIIVCCSSDFVEYRIEDNIWIYKSILPFSISIGKYKFLAKDAFYQN